jgi:hypothetical protein
VTYTQNEMAWAFNEWMRRYTEEPERFAREWETVMAFLEEDTGDNNTAQYGHDQAKYFVSLLNETSIG